MGRTKLAAFTMAALLISGLVVLYPEIVRTLTNRAPRYDPGLPPAFSGNRAAYAFALFSLFSVSSLALRKIIVIGAQLYEQDWRENPDAGLYRLAIAFLMGTILLGAGPDVALLLLWGEVAPATITHAMTADRIGDGLCLPAFLVALAFIARAEQLERHDVSAFATELANLDGARRRAFYLILPRREGLVEQTRIVAAVLIIALGLATFK